MARDFKHPSKAIEQAVTHAEAHGWRVEKSRVVPGADCSARITTAIAVAANSVSRVSGVRREIPKRMRVRSNA